MYVCVWQEDKEYMFWPWLPPTLAPGITQADEWVACKNNEGAAVRLQI